jgi:hypothetical protein
MQNSNVRRLLFPAIAASTLVFGLTLLLLGTHKSDWFEQVAQTRKEDLSRDYTLTHRGRDAAIRVVGSAIVLSVATGILTVELLRKWYAYREDIDQKAEDLGLTPLMSADAEANLEPEPELNPIAINLDSNPDLKNLDLTSPDLQVNQLQWNQSSSLDNNPTIAPLSPVHELAPTAGTTDRSLRPNSLQMHYVLEHETQRYRFVRTALNRSKMLRYSAILQSQAQSQDPTQSQEVIAKLNPDGETYSLWIKI